MLAVSMDVFKCSPQEILDIFATLEAPDLQEMNGEYKAHLLQQPGLLRHLFGQASVANPLAPWLGKAFRPVDANTGRGYNMFRVAGRVVQRFPMQTIIAPSRFDGKPAYQLIYRAYHSLCGDIHMVDEVRTLAPKTYLGIGTWGFTEAQRLIPLPFLLEGPVWPYRKDIGKVRKK